MPTGIRYFFAKIIIVFLSLSIQFLLSDMPSHCQLKLGIIISTCTTITAPKHEDPAWNVLDEHSGTIGGSSIENLFI